MTIKELITQLLNSDNIDNLAVIQIITRDSNNCPIHSKLMSIERVRPDFVSGVGSACLVIDNKEIESTTITTVVKHFRYDKTRIFD